MSYDTLPTAGTAEPKEMEVNMMRPLLVLVGFLLGAAASAVAGDGGFQLVVDPRPFTGYSVTATGRAEVQLDAFMPECNGLAVMVKISHDRKTADVSCGVSGRAWSNQLPVFQGNEFALVWKR